MHFIPSAVSDLTALSNAERKSSPSTIGNNGKFYFYINKKMQIKVNFNANKAPLILITVAPHAVRMLAYCSSELSVSRTTCTPLSTVPRGLRGWSRDTSSFNAGGKESSDGISTQLLSVSPINSSHRTIFQTESN